MKTIFATTIALTIIGTSLFANSAKADIPMQVSNDDGLHFLVVPNSETTSPAYGGKLRLYDVHIAKMFEMSHYYCQYGRENVFIWRYLANGGKTYMGTFRITCRLANEVVSAYGLGKTEYTPTSGRAANVPTLKITGDKIDTWMNFTQNFKSIQQG